MTSLVTHRYTTAVGIITNVHNEDIPSYAHFRNGGMGVLPVNTYRVKYDTGIPALDLLLSYYSASPYAQHYPVSVNHSLVARFALSAIASHGWGPGTSDAITVVWMATVGNAAFVAANGAEPSARRQFYNKGLEDGFFYTCSEWKEFL